MVNSSREAFVRELESGGQQLNLARTALLLAQYLGQPVDVPASLAAINELAEPLKPQIQVAAAPEKLALLHRHLFETSGFSGNVRDYYSPENSFLNYVLDQRTGIPISLSVVYLEVGWRLNLPVWGIGLPRHFIAGYGPQDDPVYVDVFNRGAILSLEACMEIAGAGHDNPRLFRERFLRPVSRRLILHRMLLNLKQIYFSRKEWDPAYRVVDLLTLVSPRQAEEHRDLGLLALRQNRLQDALFSLNRFLHLAPQHQDSNWIKDRVRLIEERLAQLN